MKNNFLYLIVILIFITSNFTLASGIIPQPQELKASEGHFVFNKKTTIYADDTMYETANYLSNALQGAMGYKLKVVKQSKLKSKYKNAIVLTKTTASSLGAEGYTLNVNKSGVFINSENSAGAFYGVQSLLQLLPVQIVMKTSCNSVKKWTVPFVEIKDKPRFAWRAFMLDESRYFKGKEVVKQLLDQMAMHKMNVFHWHLVDDQGWRIQIDKYPLLTQIGSKRKASQIGGWESTKYDTKVHEGFYTKEQIREILAYANQLHIKVVPEIDMPGHATAAIASYGWLGSTGKVKEVSINFGGSEDKDVFDVSKPEVRQFCEDVLTEIMDIFPSEVIHIGGDEVRFEKWKDNESIKQFMSDHNLKNYAEVQMWFTNYISKFIASKGRRMMGWNEITGDQVNEYNNDVVSNENKLSKNAIVHFWKGELNLLNKAVSEGHDVVNSYHIYTYLDYTGVTPAKAYSFDPIPEGLDAKYHKQVLGLGCQMWSEWIPEVNDLHNRVFPKISAYAEVGWTNNDVKNYDNFKVRMLDMTKRWDLIGIGYRKYE